MVQLLVRVGCGRVEDHAAETQSGERLPKSGAAFEYGRRAASSVVVLDNALLRRLIDGARE